MLKKSVVPISVVASVAIASIFPAAAQSLLSYPSPIGLPSLQATGPSHAIGGSGIGVASDYFGMAENPGNLGALTRSSFAAIASMDLLSLEEGDSISQHAKLSPLLLSFAFPLKKAGVFGFSLDRRSDARLKYRTRQTVTHTNGVIDTLDYGFSKNGGITSWQAGWGYSIGSVAHFGLSYERLYFFTDEITMWRAAMADTIGNPLSSTLNDTTTISMRGNAVRGGILFPFKKLTLGLTGEYILPGTAKRQSIIQSADRVDTVTTRFSLELPPSLGMGASYTFSPRYFAAVSGGMTLWQRYASDFKLGNTPDNAYFFALGGQFIPAPNLLVPRYYEIMQYRAGFRYTQLPSATGSEVAFTLSLGLPFQQGSGLFDIILDAGRRTDASYEDFTENFLRIKIGLNGGRKWFQNTGIRY